MKKGPRHSAAVWAPIAAALLAATEVLAGAVPGPITVLAIDPQTPSTLYAVARVTAVRQPTSIRDQLFRSDDSGATWQPTTTPGEEFATAPDFGIGSIVVDPQVRGVVYATVGTEVQVGRQFIPIGAVFKSTDGGSIWTKLDRGNHPNSIVVDPVMSTTIYAGASYPDPDSIFKSVNSGAEWFDVSPPGYDACAVLGIDPSNSSVLYAGGCVTPLFRSADAGASWTASALGLPADALVYSFSIARSRPAILYAGFFDRGIYRSVDSGAHWTPASTGIGSTAILALAVDPRSASIAYAGTSAGLFKTSTGGALWLPDAPGLENAAINAIVIDPSSPDTVYSGTSVGAFKSVDAGLSWSSINSGLPPASVINPVPPAQATAVRALSR